MHAVEGRLEPFKVIAGLVGHNVEDIPRKIG